MATRLEVRDRAASDLGLLQLGQSLSHDDSVRILAAYDEVYADLKEEGLATWTSTGAVPAEIVPHMSALIAINCTETYGTSDSRYARILAKASIAKREIRRLVTRRYESFDDVVDY